MQKRNPATDKTRGITRDDIQIQSHEIPIDMLEQWLTEYAEVTASMLVKAEVDIGARQVVLGVVTGSGFDVRTKAEIAVPFKTGHFFANIVMAENFRLFTGTDTLFMQKSGSLFTFGDLRTVVQALSTIKGANGERVPDIYFATPQTAGWLVQYVMLPSGEIIFLNPTGRPGMTDIRYVPANHGILLGIKTNAHGHGMAITVMSLQRLRMEQDAIRNMATWNSAMEPPNNRVIQSLGRPKVDTNGQIKLTARLMDVRTSRIYESTAIITKRGRGYICEWSEGIEQTAPRIPIGEMSGRSDLCVSSIPGNAVATLLFETQRTANPAGQLLLRTS